MNKLFAVFVALIALVVFGAQVARSQILADALFLKSGEKVEGRIIAESDLSVTISTDTSTGKAERMISRSEISNITRSEPLAPTETPNADSPESPDRSSVSPDKKWECQRRDEDDLGPKIVKAGTNEVALDLSDECRGSVDWSPDSKRFALTCRERGRSNGGTSLYQLRGGEWKPLKSPNDDVQEILNKAIAAQVKKSGLPKKTDLRLIWETLEVRRWVDSNTAILYAGLHEVVRENSETRFDVDFLFTLKFDDAGNWKIIKTHQMSDKEIEKEDAGEDVSGSGQTTKQEGLSADASFRDADRHLNEVYNALRARLSPPERDRLRKEQFAWLNQRNAAVQVAKKNAHENPTDGADGKVTKMTLARVTELEKRLKKGK